MTSGPHPVVLAASARLGGSGVDY